MIIAHYTAYDFYLERLATLPDKFFYSMGYIARKHLVTIFCNPKK
jgi:hypothetical protein